MAVKAKSIPFVLLLAACASMGTPDGGRYDEEPPYVVHSKPDFGALNNREKKIDIRFNEFIKLENANEQVVVSPPQTEIPNIRAVGKSVRVTLYDSLQPNTTYTIDFGDAIADNNEGNPMGRYTFSFSTGSQIDTMEVSGFVLNAQDLEPVKGMMVGLYAADSLWHDTLFRSKPFLRVGRTNGSGAFSIKGVRQGCYRVFALQDMDGNHRFSQKAEAIAWDTTIVHTTQRPDLRADTLWLDSTRIERIRMVPYIHYYPDNLVLRSFLEGGQDQHFLKSERKDPYSFTLFFTAPQDTLPLLRGVDFDAQKALLLESSTDRDTLIYWITDTALAHRDTISFELTYPDTDSTGVAVARTERFDLVPRLSYERMERERQKKIADWEAEQEKKRKHSKQAYEKPENPYLESFVNVSLRPGTSIAPNQNFVLEFNEPISFIDSTKIHFEIKHDSLFHPCPFLLLPQERSQRHFTLYAEWQPKGVYRLRTDSLAFLSCLNHASRPLKYDLRVDEEDAFGSIFVRLIGDRDTDTTRIVQLLSASDKVVSQQRVRQGRADFFYIRPSNYYLRMFIDANGNGKWDTGNYDLGVQPEEVFYFPQSLPLKARFDIEQAWDYRSLPLTKQKPKEITKQKADKRKTIRERNREREREHNH